MLVVENSPKSLFFNTV